MKIEQSIPTEPNKVFRIEQQQNNQLINYQYFKFMAYRLHLNRQSKKRNNSAYGQRNIKGSSQKRTT